MAEMSLEEWFKKTNAGVEAVICLRCESPHAKRQYHPNGDVATKGDYRACRWGDAKKSKKPHWHGYHMSCWPLQPNGRYLTWPLQTEWIDEQESEHGPHNEST